MAGVRGSGGMGVKEKNKPGRKKVAVGLRKGTRISEQIHRENPIEIVIFKSRARGGDDC